MIDRVAYELQERRPQRIQHGAIELDLTAAHAQAHLFL